MLGLAAAWWVSADAVGWLIRVRAGVVEVAVEG